MLGLNIQDHIAGFVSSKVVPYLPSEKREVNFKKHPLHTLYHLLKRAYGAEKSSLHAMLYSVPENLRNSLFFEVWSQATDKSKGGERWGEHHALDDSTRLLKVIQNVVEGVFDKQSDIKKNQIYYTMHRMAGQPKIDHLLIWGKEEVKRDTERLIRALHRNHCLDIPGTSISVYTELEKGIETPSCSFHLYRKELPRGQIGFHNGIRTTFASAKENALRLSNEVCQNYNIHCTYSATASTSLDLASAVLGQAKVVTPPVIHLLEQWQDFMEQEENVCLLQLCYSRGAIEVHNALLQAPLEMRKRITVIAIAPASFIPSELAFHIVHLIVLGDSVVEMATKSGSENLGHIITLQQHTNTSDSHDLHGSSYHEQLRMLVDAYIKTNSYL